MVRELLLKNKRMIVLASFIGACSSLFSLYLIIRINDSVNNDVKDITDVALPFLMALIGLFVLGVIAQHLLTLLSSRIVKTLRTSISSWMLDKSYEEVERIGAHKIYVALTADITKISQGLAVFPVAIFNLATVVVCLVYLGFLSPELFTVLILILGFAIGIAYLIMKYGLVSAQESREMEDVLFKSFRSLVEGSKEFNLSAHQRNFFLNQRLNTEIDNARKKENEAQLYWNISVNWTNLILFFALAVLVVVSKLYFPVGAGILASFIFILVYISGSIGFLMNANQAIARAVIGMKKVDNLGLNKNRQAPSEIDNQFIRPKSFCNIDIKGLTYNYQDDESESNFAIGPIDFNIKQSEVLFIVGGNGSGKTTFIKNLLTLYGKKEGVVSLDGQIVSEDNLDWYRSHFTAVFSDCHLFEQVLDHEGKLADDELVLSYLKRFNLSSRISVNNGKLSSTDVSSGQEKRLALIQSYISDAPIFIFDEWAAEQDPYFRELFYREILPELKARKKTVIAITHDDAYFDAADRIIKFEQGLCTELDYEALKMFSSKELFNERTITVDDTIRLQN
ncbi:hypothetical protein CJF42_03450 [Pseudoalteromonas sp. NBT06-2]|uniref:cyclic peptide export ABC transporter n=1 Tax=Pseudoalteromonas sp. NBT06-2 TaxID=2025950 RepID=UPI000BA7C4FB|nr:cyclic peptide export ABC transporter [Pseudoalteromonas sp. NBT06-2]PAJ75784.1 hypothetical protein CJF42_03450 [Pseudoalteromonas sp. NBT06-2]